MAVSISICNLALGDLRAPAIAEIAENSVEAQHCARYYPEALQCLLDGYPWSFATKVAALALLSDNERSTEWAYCYALPDNSAAVARLLPTGTATISPIGWPYDQMQAPRWWLDFIVEDNKLYTNVADAVAEYGLATIDEDVMSPTFKKALRKQLAADLAVPLRDSREMKGDLLQEAERALQDAAANDANRQINREPFDEVAWARR
jgi:hypothetical protein